MSISAQDQSQNSSARKGLEASFNLIEEIPVPIIIYRGRDLIIENYNAELYKFFMTDKEVLGLPLREVVPESIYNLYVEKLQRVFDTGITYEGKEDYLFYEFEGERKGIYINYILKAIKDQDGKVWGVIAMSHDVTESVEARKITEEKAAILSSIIESSNDSIISQTPDGTITSWNKGAENIYGYTPDEMIGKSILKIIPAEYVEERKIVIDKLRKGEKVQSFESKRITKDKRLLDVSLTISPVKDLNGEFKGASIVARDITEQKRNQRLIAESQNRLRLIADSMPQLIWAGNRQGNLNYFNLAFLNFSGLKIEELADGGLLQIVHPEDRERSIKEWVKSVKSGKPFHFEHRFLRSDGTYRWQLSRANAQLDQQGKIQMWVGTSTDIHDQKIFTQELEDKVRERTKDLQEANRGLEKMNQELASFAYISSHDLQEPLRKIQTFAAHILDKEEKNLSESGKDNFQRMQKAAGRMQNLIEDLLTYSRTNTKEKVFEKTDMNSLMLDVQVELERLIQEKQAVIDVGPLPDLNIIPYQFRQLFTNLISNALKFSKKGTNAVIKIEASSVRGSRIDHPAAIAKKTYHHISVTDNGIGFAAEHSEKIFEVFQRLHGRSEYEGTGIGLSIAKKIIENHYGIINAMSEPGRGAVFNVYIPQTIEMPVA